MTQRYSWSDARRIVGEAAVPRPPEWVGLSAATGRLAAEDVTALQDIPHYESSAMDGWAVAGDPPWSLVTSPTLGASQAASIVTGGIVPPGTLGVLRREFGEVVGGLLRPTADARIGEPGSGSHIRARGTEAHRGEVLITAGTVLNPAHVALAASCGRDSLLVRARPQVALLLTGDEVVESGVPEPGQVRDSYRAQFPAVIGLLGARVVSTTRVSDTLSETVARLRSLEPAHELVVITGGTGLSDADHVRGALLAVRATILIESVAMRPGSPSMAARLPDGRLVVALPGNPLAAILGLLTLVGPAIAGLAGEPPVEPIEVEVGTAVAGHQESTVLAPCVVVGGVARPTRWRGSAMMRGFAEATAVLIVPPGGVAESGRALALPLPWC